MALAVASTALVAAPSPARAAVSPDVFEDCLLDRLNQERADNGRVQLQMATDLVPEVRDWSRWMRFNDFKHMPSSVRSGILPDSTTIWGENIAMHSWQNMPDCETIHQMWMNSQGHRENILRSSFRYVAIGTYVDSSGWWATQLFFDASDYHATTALPFGWLEQVSGQGGSIRVRGWAIDPDTERPTHVHVYVDGAFAAGIRADISRPDVERAFGYGSDHGFNREIAASAGKRRVCVYAINAPTARGNTSLGCRSVTVGQETTEPRDEGASPASGSTAPFGWFDRADISNGTLSIKGWAIDRDRPSEAVGIHVYVNGKYFMGGSAATSRPDVDRAFGLGAEHGFSMKKAIGSNTPEVCVYAIDTPNGSGNTLLGCKSVR